MKCSLKIYLQIKVLVKADLQINSSSFFFLIHPNAIILYRIIDGSLSVHFFSVVHTVSYLPLKYSNSNYKLNHFMSSFELE